MPNKVLQKFCEIVTNVVDTSRNSRIISHQTGPIVRRLSSSFENSFGSRDGRKVVEIIAVAVLSNYPRGFISPVDAPPETTGSAISDDSQFFTNAIPI